MHELRVKLTQADDLELQINELDEEVTQAKSLGVLAAYLRFNVVEPSLQHP